MVLFFVNYFLKFGTVLSYISYDGINAGLLQKNIQFPREIIQKKLEITHNCIIQR